MISDPKEIGLGAGAVYVYGRTQVSWALETKLKSSDADQGDRFGRSIDLDGDRLAVSAYLDQTAFGDTGSVYLFERSGTEWSEVRKIQRPDLSPAPSPMQFGEDLILQDNVLIAGANADEVSDGLGSLYEFRIDTGVHTSFCFGNAGCAACPCGNDARPESRGGCRNSAQTSCTLVAGGNAGVSNDTLTFELHGGLPGTPHLLMSADNALPSGGVCPAGSGTLSSALDGLRCIGGNLARHGTRLSAETGDLTMPLSGWDGLIGPNAFSAGQERHFQAFYREDPTAQCGSGVNTSNAVSVTFVP